MPATLDDLMQTASQALADMDYARCERLCAEALNQARAEEHWVMAQRVLLPLQEARRQKRQSALDGLILLGVPAADDEQELLAFLKTPRLGCIVLTQPTTAEQAARVEQSIAEQGLAIEVLFADNPMAEPTWRIRTASGPAASVDQPAPVQWAGRLIDPMRTTPPTPAHWFMQASEALGDAALAAIGTAPGTVDYFDALARVLDAVGDHEILHQRLAQAAKALHEATR